MRQTRSAETEGEIWHWIVREIEMAEVRDRESEPKSERECEA